MLKKIEILSKNQPSLRTHIVLKKVNDFSSALLDNVTKRVDLMSAEDSLQFATIRLQSEETFVPHIHEKFERKARVGNTQEVWVVLVGRVLASLYDIDRRLLIEVELSPGDAVITINGGHNYLGLERDSLVYEIKSGPYDADLDKTRF